VVDLERAGARLNALDLGGPTPVVEIRKRARLRTRRRRAATATAALTALAVLTATAAAIRSSDTGRQLSTVHVGPGSTRSVGDPIRDGPHPAGSTRIDYGQLRLWLPPGWILAPASSICPVPDSVVFGTPPGACSTPGPDVVVEPISGPVPKTNGITQRINGWPVVERQTESKPVPRFDIWVPDLGVELTASGPEGQSGPDPIIASLGESSLNALIHNRDDIPVPTGWQTVTYHSFTFQVPPSWPVETDLNARGACQPLPAFATPVVELSPKIDPPSCNASAQTFTGGDGLSLYYGAPGRLSSGLSRGNVIPISMSPAATVHEHQLTLTIAYAPGQFSTSAVVEITDRTSTITALVGLGVSPVIPGQILASIRPGQPPP
jgi:hypothetical protein